VVHGLSIPLGKFGYFLPRLPRTLSRAFSQSRDETRDSSQAPPANTSVPKAKMPAGRDEVLMVDIPSTRTVRYE